MPGTASGTIAGVSYPPPTKLEPAAEKRIAIASVALIAVGLISVIPPADQR